LGYLPFAEDEGLATEVCRALKAIAFRSGKLEPVVLNALKDDSPVRRAAAAEAICQPPGAKHLSEVKELLGDKDRMVKVRVALALATAGDIEAVPVLINQVGEEPYELGSRGEEFLRTLAGEDSPEFALEDSATSRSKSCDAWQKWYKEKGSALNLAKSKQPH